MELELFVDICSFLGAWLLVAGPIYQASIELHEEDIEFERIHEASSKLKIPKRVSAWWWLLPPIKIILQRRQSRAYRKEYLKLLSKKDTEDIIAFTNKATGWIIVASGALLIAIKETFDLVDELGWSFSWFWVFIPLMLLLSLRLTVLRTARARKIIDLSENS